MTIKNIFKNKTFKKFLMIALIYILPALCFASVESSLMAIQGKLVGTILPLAAILGFIFAGFSYISGSPNARTHLILAIIGAAVGFGASSIVSMIRSLVN
jgi:type IV secretory pathway VirB2 component (pilin)